MTTNRTVRGASRGAPLLRLRVGLVVIAMVLSFFGARLVQLQGIDPKSYAAMAAAEGAVKVPLLAERGDILDRNGIPLADSIQGKMVVADPTMTADDAPEIARLLSDRLSIDYFKTLAALRGRDEGSRFEYIARRVPSTLASDTVLALDEAGYEGVSLRDDPIRDYPDDDVAANLVGFMGTDEPLGGFERTFDTQLAGTDGMATWQSNSRKGVRIPLGESSLTAAKNGAPLRTTIDLDLQWFTQQVLAQTVSQYRAQSGAAIVMDTRTGEILALADVPDLRRQQAARLRRGRPRLARPQRRLRARLGREGAHRRVADRRRQGLPAPALRGARHPLAPGPFDRRLVRPRQHPADARRHHRQVLQHRHRARRRRVQRRPSSWPTSSASASGTRTDVGVRGETPGILTPGDVMTSQTKDRVAFGQSLSVNVVQMAAAINTVANGGVRIEPEHHQRLRGHR